MAGTFRKRPFKAIIWQAQNRVVEAWREHKLEGKTKKEKEFVESNAAWRLGEAIKDGQLHKVLGKMFDWRKFSSMFLSRNI